MPAAPEPKNEVARLEELKLYDIMDTVVEEQYEQIVQMASYICDVPIAFISFVDKDRQWFKARVGLDAEETHRDSAFCAHAILEPNKMLIVEDALTDERFIDSTLVLESPHIRFYAGYPLTTPSGYAFGTLCAIDSKPKKITEKQKDVLKILGENVVTLLELRKSNAERGQLIEKLKKSNEDLERFAYIASHDMQEPLRTISSFTELLDKRYGDKLDDSAAEYVRYCNEGSARLQAIVNDLLDYSRLNGKEKTLISVDLNEVMAMAMDSILLAVEDAGGEVTYENLPTIQTNQLLILRVLQNLLFNAIKYKSKGAKPIVNVSVEQVNGCWRFCVKDNGIGINQKHYKEIFNPFKRLHGRSEYDGTGMGLAICQKIIEDLGGKIWVESVVDEGSSFYFTLPGPMIASANKN